MVLGETLANVVIAAEDDVVRDARLISVQSQTLLLLALTVSRMLALLLLLLCEVELIDPAVTVLSVECRHGVSRRVGVV